MGLAKEDVFKKEFSVVFRGYKEREVDAFLDEVIATFDEWEKEKAQMQEDIKKLQKRIDDYVALEDTLKETIVSAQRAAADITAKAEQEKEDILAQAMADAAEIQGSAQHDADAVLGEATRRCEEIEEQYRAIVAKGKDMRDAIMKLVAYQMKELEELPLGAEQEEENFPEEQEEQA